MRIGRLQFDGFRIFLVRLLSISPWRIDLREPENRFLILRIFPQRGPVFLLSFLFY
jgi:hypothetical protein